VTGRVAAGPDSLRAVSVPLPPGLPIDPLAVAGPDGVAFCSPWLVLTGRGVAAELALPAGLDSPADLRAAGARLADIPCADRVGRPGSGVVAQTALPFRRGAPGRLVLPRLTYGRDERGHEWVTLVTGPGEPAGALDPARLRHELSSAGPAPGPVDDDLTPTAPAVRAEAPGAYADAVATAVAAIRAGTLDKVVLARAVELEFASPPSPLGALRRLHAREPSCTAFLHPVAGGWFLGASPELLVSRRGRRVRCNPLAGTVGLPGGSGPDDEAAARLRRSAKDRGEHRLVVEEVAATLEPCCSRLDVPATPSLVRLRSVAHLATTIAGTLRSVGGRAPGVLELVGLLHPTPAVGGVPRSAALSLIEELEPGDRQHWAGPVGWVDARGDGDFVIGIRSATLAGPRVTVRAGCGIVEASDPAAELAEASVKLASVLGALAPALAPALGGDLLAGSGRSAAGVIG